MVAAVELSALPALQPARPVRENVVTAVVLVGGPADGRLFELADPAPRYLRVLVPDPVPAWSDSIAELPAAIPHEVATYLRGNTWDIRTRRRQYVHA
jgi:hypothetical protein